MKKQFLMIVALTACFGFGAIAQVSVNVNIGAQPVWGPVGYDYVEYYYMPDIDAYYDVPHHQYVYMENNIWVTRRNLPPRYTNYDLYGGHKVVINERNPWMHHDRYRQEYGQYRGRHDQVVIRDSRDVRYYENPRHPHHNEWRGGNPGGPHNPRQVYGPGNGNGNQGRGHGDHHDNGNGHGNGHGEGRGEGHGGGHGHR